MSFEGFDLSQIDLGDIALRVRRGGSGPLLLLHRAPQTHMMWGKIAGDLARYFTVIAPTCAAMARAASRRRARTTSTLRSARWRAMRSR